MEQSPVQGADQQERLLCWLGGIIDGEGCITINHHRLHRGEKKETLLFSPLLSIANTNKILVDQCCEILADVGIPYYVSHQTVEQVESYRSSNGRPRRARYYITIVGLKRVARALNILMPYIRSKRFEASLVKEFCDKRLSGDKSKRYDVREFDIIEMVAKIHNRNPQRLHAEILEYKSRNKI